VPSSTQYRPIEPACGLGFIPEARTQPGFSMSDTDAITFALSVATATVAMLALGALAIAAADRLADRWHGSG
jgi:hypothetical protein